MHTDELSVVCPRLLSSSDPRHLKEVGDRVFVVSFSLVYEGNRMKPAKLCSNFCFSVPTNQGQP
ncbi:hypothetical protein NIES4073_20870 [Kalymmatonema gypsitolerans NIES-4073]|nr:hypothetical protein NIES4073_20870 [Scytonema sp. NIES-4073]